MDIKLANEETINVKVGSGDSQDIIATIQLKQDVSPINTIDSYISSMTNLQKLHLTNTSVVATWNAKLADITCDIYVPDALVDSYKATAGWVDIADRIKPESDFDETYTE